MNPGNLHTVLVLVNKETPRISYVFEFLSENNRLLHFKLTADAAAYAAWEGYRMNYAGSSADGEFSIEPHPVMFGEDIVPVAFDLDFFRERKNGADKELPISLNKSQDIVAFIFYLVSRYEEYLPHKPDVHGRFDHRESILWQLDALHFPLVDELVLQLCAWYIPREAVLKAMEKEYRFQNTLDIDQAYLAQGKGMVRNIGGFVKYMLKGEWNESRGRLKVLMGKKDLFDSHRFILSLQKKYKFQQKVFFLVGRHSRFDPGLPTRSTLLKKLVKRYAASGIVGVHPSYLSSRQKQLIGDEKKVLEIITGNPVVTARQHFLRFTLPSTYEALEEAGILYEYSMGYTETNGFRAGTCKPFTWFNLGRNSKGSIKVFPLSCMDGTLFKTCEKKMEKILPELKQRADSCKKYGGVFIPLFHNHLLSGDARGQEWKGVYEEMIRYAVEKGN